MTDVPAILAGLGPMEPAGLETQPAMLDTCSQHVIGDVRGILPMVADRRFRELARGIAMRECHRTQSRIAYRGDEKLGDSVLAERVRVVDAERHDEVVWMLAVDDGPAIGGFAGLENQRVAAIRDGQRFEAEHGLEEKGAAARFVLEHI